MKHSNIVGGSTAERVINCPGSVKLVATMPPKESSSYADEGTLLHDCIADLLNLNVKSARDMIGRTYNGQTLTEELVEEKLLPAMRLLNSIDPDNQMDYEVEQRVGFGDLLPGVFGSADLLGRLGDTAIVLDWKFGSGVMVEAEENYQGLFYACAARRTDLTKWVFKGATKVLVAIVQPPGIKIWETTPERLDRFEEQLVSAVKEAKSDNALLAAGKWCKWCAAKPVCPVMTGEVDRVRAAQIAALPAAQIGEYLKTADALEGWITDLRALAFQMLESGVEVPGYKLVAKRATRSWVNEDAAKALLLAHLPESELVEVKMCSPAVVEKKLKKLKLALPEGSTAAVSSGVTLADVDDPRPQVMQLGSQLKSALTKLQG
jgi:hypothetical protein